jgi:hypothetical protein
MTFCDQVRGRMKSTKETFCVSTCTYITNGSGPRSVKLEPTTPRQLMQQQPLLLPFMSRSSPGEETREPFRDVLPTSRRCAFHTLRMTDSDGLHLVH